MDFSAASLIQVFRDEIYSLGFQSGLTLLSTFPYQSISSFEDFNRYLARNQLLGDDSGVVELNTLTSTTGDSTAQPPAPATTDQVSLGLQRYLQLHALKWPNALVRVVVPKSKYSALVDVNKELAEAKRQETAAENNSTNVNPVYRVGVVRSVSFSLPKTETQKTPPTGPSSTLADFVTDYLMKMIYFTIDFGDCIDQKFAVKFVSNDPFISTEFSTLVRAVTSVAVPASSAMSVFFRESPHTTQLKLYSCRLAKTSSGTKTTLPIPSRKYPTSLQRSFVSSEPLKTTGALQLTRTLQQLLAIEGADGLAEAALDENTDATNAVGASSSPILTYKELNVILHNIVAPQLVRLNQSLLEQEGNGGSSVSGEGANFAQLSESRKELFGVQQELKKTSQKNAALQAEVDRLSSELQAERAKVKATHTTNEKLLDALKTVKAKAIENQRLLTESKSMLKMNDQAGPEEVIQALRRKLGQ